MNHDFLFIIDPLETLQRGHDTSLIIMEEASSRGHRVWYTTLHGLRMKGNRPEGTLHKISFDLKKERWEMVQTEDIALETMQIIFMRKDPPFNIDYIMAASLLSFVDREKTHVINDPDALRTFNEKLGIFNFPEYIPPTFVSKSKEKILDFIAQEEKVVLKPLELNSGQGIIVLDHTDKNAHSLLEILTQDGHKYIMVQRYLPEVTTQGDIRVITLNGSILGAVRRIAPSHDHRSNLHVGARAEKVALTNKEEKMCQDIAHRLTKMGILFSGFDIICGYLTEINITSPTGIVEINMLEGVQLERNVIDFFEQLAA